MLLPLLIILLAPFAASQERILSSPPVAFVNVNVIPMDRERVLTSQTVIVRNGLKTSPNPASAPMLRTREHILLARQVG